MPEMRAAAGRGRRARRGTFEWTRRASGSDDRVDSSRRRRRRLPIGVTSVELESSPSLSLSLPSLSPSSSLPSPVPSPVASLPPPPRPRQPRAHRCFGGGGSSSESDTSRMSSVASRALPAGARRRRRPSPRCRRRGCAGASDVRPALPLAPPPLPPSLSTSPRPRRGRAAARRRSSGCHERDPCAAGPARRPDPAISLRVPRAGASGAARQACCWWSASPDGSRATVLVLYAVASGAQSSPAAGRKPRGGSLSRKQRARRSLSRHQYEIAQRRAHLGYVECASQRRHQCGVVDGKVPNAPSAPGQCGHEPSRGTCR